MTKALPERHLAQGYRVAPLGQSMGGSTVLVAATQLGDRLSSVVTWVPDPSIDEMAEVEDYNEEGGQRVGLTFWREAHDADIVRRFREIRVPTLVFFATDDEYVSEDNQRALIDAKQSHQRIEILDRHSHCSWSYDQAERVIELSKGFLLSHFR